MVFHSFEFILLFLPLAYVGFLAAHRIAGWPGAIRFLVAASLVFYSRWSLAFTLILVLSIVANYVIGNAIIKTHRVRPQFAWALLLAGLALNLVGLGYFKYSNFLIDIANSMTGSGMSHIHLILPVGISFYTFVQIGYLIDCYNGQVQRPGLDRYALFACFFPCVTAGPLVLEREMLDQMKDRRDPAFDTQRLAAGLTLFGIGLFKKVFLADAIAPFADTVFDGVSAGQAATGSVAWLGATSYALQLYFDFSGYSDMALGLGLMFGLKLPLNFDSPFKATSISDFWRRWHMTMTRFFTTYIYTPLAMRGMRSAMSRGAGRLEKFLLTGGIPALVTFLVAGVWHGAGWAFVVYGVVHGTAIAVNLAWREARLPSLPPAIGWLLTMAVVVSGLVVFRAPNLTVALHILRDMWTFGLGHASAAADLVVIDRRMALSGIVLLGAIVLLLPNSQQMLHRYWVSSDAMPTTARMAAGLVSWRPSLALSLGLAVTLSIAIASIGAGSTFLYYQF
ncbi:MAG: MBOAT family protein [Proteobacteria bacterium]|nr:MBOAT family protein [Pseudomonadota bacterium]